MDLLGHRSSAPVGTSNDWSSTVTVHTGAATADHDGNPPPAESVRLAHRGLTAVGAAITTGPGDKTVSGGPPGTFTVYVFALPEAAQTD
ncbi:hypothetical protein [Streptomyces sp. HUAS TT7]|uniref:hypothetical protein n=1 Tax=Streptomyces sp. HUAS TT7 TaxID=3447507 RepID=UPI003F656DFE